MLTLAASSLHAVKQYERSRSHLIPSGVCWPFVNWLHFHDCTFNKGAKCQWLRPSPDSALRRLSTIHEPFTCLFSCKILQSFCKNVDTVQLISGCWACTARSGLRFGSCDLSHWRNKSQPSHAEMLLVLRLPLQAGMGLCWREYVRTES